MLRNKLTFKTLQQNPIEAINTRADESIDMGNESIEITSVTVPDSIDQVRESFDEFNSSVNESGSPYNARNNNSNTYAGDAYEYVTGITPYNNTDLYLPDFHDDLE